ncbi:unnamed protein product, partial [marine sediment metagenome]
MKPGRKWVILGVMAVLVIVLVIIVLAFLPSESPREAEARRLVAELRKPSRFRKWLAELGVVQPSGRRDPYYPHAIARELAALGQSAVPVCIRALRDDDSHVRYWVASALGQMDPVPSQAAPA